VDYVFEFHFDVFFLKNKKIRGCWPIPFLPFSPKGRYYGCT
jgi:hypothetical protein